MEDLYESMMSLVNLIEDNVRLMESNSVKVRCEGCALWNYNKFPNAKVMGLPCGCTVYKGLGRAPNKYCSEGEPICQ